MHYKMISQSFMFGIGKTKDSSIRIKVIATLILMSVICMVSFAQSNPGNVGPSSYEVQLIPSSPENSDLGKFGELPINKYNGTANVSIPIHTEEMRGKSIPLALGYNTGGVRVNQDLRWLVSVGIFQKASS